MCAHHFATQLVLSSCSAGTPDGMAAGSESCSDCGGVGRSGDMKLLGNPCPSCLNGMAVALGLFGMHSCEVGGVLVQAIWVGEGWLCTRCVREGVTSVLTVESVRGCCPAGITVSTGGVIKFIHIGTI